MGGRTTYAGSPAPLAREKASYGMALLYDAERVGQSRKMLVEARKRKLSAGLKARREQGRR